MRSSGLVLWLLSCAVGCTAMSVTEGDDVGDLGTKADQKVGTSFAETPQIDDARSWYAEAGREAPAYRLPLVAGAKFRVRVERTHGDIEPELALFPTIEAY